MCNMHTTLSSPLLMPATFGRALWLARRRSSPHTDLPSTHPAVELAGGFPPNHRLPPCAATTTSSLVARLSDPPLQLVSSTRQSSTSLPLPSIQLYFFVAAMGSSGRSMWCRGSVGGGEIDERWLPVAAGSSSPRCAPQSVPARGCVSHQCGDQQGTWWSAGRRGGLQWRHGGRRSTS
jgi:hypothetical protein